MKLNKLNFLEKYFWLGDEEKRICCFRKVPKGVTKLRHVQKRSKRVQKRRQSFDVSDIVSHRIEFLISLFLSPCFTSKQTEVHTIVLTGTV